MKAIESYYLILFVYVSLWSCQLIAGHLTHSLIILTDSYVNLYKILDILLGIVHLRTQQELRASRYDSSSNKTVTLAVRLFDRICTYQFKRLPLLGSFVNGLFLAALLMSAAIEGIQTCFHASHLPDADEKSILLEHPLTYPAVLIGFALVGAIMQWCSIQAHRMREEELDSESLLDMRQSGLEVVAEGGSGEAPRELSAEQLHTSHSPSQQFKPQFEPYPVDMVGLEKRNTICLGSRTLSFGPQKQIQEHQRTSKRKFFPCSTKHRSLESVPTAGTSEPNQISLKSLKIITSNQLENQNFVSLKTVSNNNDSQNNTSTIPTTNRRQPPPAALDKTLDWWLLLRYCTSPIALVVCALIVYFINKEMVTEIADAFLAVLVVVLLFAASYPPMKRAGRVLLQTAPDGVDLDRLKTDLMTESQLIVDVKQLNVWSLTPTTNRVATCHLIIRRDQIKSERQLSMLLAGAKSKFLEQNIKCSTIQPVFLDSATSQQH